LITNTEQQESALRLLAQKYMPNIDPTSEIAKYADKVLILKLSIERMTGKEAIELTKQRKTLKE
jgi:hypothetical protein